MSRILSEDDKLHLYDPEAWAYKHKNDISTIEPDMFHYIKRVHIEKSWDEKYYTYDYFMNHLMKDNSLYGKLERENYKFFNIHTGEEIISDPHYYYLNDKQKRQQEAVKKGICTYEELNAKYSDEAIEHYKKYDKSFEFWFLIIAMIFCTLVFNNGFISIFIMGPIIIVGLIMKKKVNKDVKLDRLDLKNKKRG